MEREEEKVVNKCHKSRSGTTRMEKHAEIGNRLKKMLWPVVLHLTSIFYEEKKNHISRL